MHHPHIAFTQKSEVDCFLAQKSEFFFFHFLAEPNQGPSDFWAQNIGIFGGPKSRTGLFWCQWFFFVAQTSVCG